MRDAGQEGVVGPSEGGELEREVVLLRAENRRLRIEKKIVAMLLIAAGFILLFYSFASSRGQLRAVSAPPAAAERATTSGEADR